jgi:DNA-binding response OmpR family regulator
MANVLLVEDDDSTRGALCALIRLAGHHCWATSEGRVAIALCQQRSFDCVILDNGLPDLPGTDVAVALSHLAAPPPVIMVSGQTFHTFDWTVAVGVVLELHRKPVRPERLLESIARVSAH